MLVTPLSDAGFLDKNPNECDYQWLATRMLTSVKRLKEVYYRAGLRQKADEQVIPPLFP